MAVRGRADSVELDGWAREREHIGVASRALPCPHAESTLQSDAVQRWQRGAR
jgi:hypothetical protein